MAGLVGLTLRSYRPPSVRIRQVSSVTDITYLKLHLANLRII